MVPWVLEVILFRERTRERQFLVLIFLTTGSLRAASDTNSEYCLKELATKSVLGAFYTGRKVFPNNT